MPLFKYLSAKIASTFAKTLRVRFTQPFDLNDPFEFRPLIDFKATTEEFRVQVDAKITGMFDTLDNALATIEKYYGTEPEHPKLPIPIKAIQNIITANPALEQKFMADLQRYKSESIDALTSVALWESIWERVHQTFGQQIGILSLAEDPAHPLMWGHYASAHSGIAVEFDENHAWFHQKITPVDDMRHLVRVAYVHNQHPLTWKQLDGYAVLYTKNADWAYEREWRIVRPLKDGVEVKPGIFCFAVPPDAVRSMILGCRVAESTERELRLSIAMNKDLGHIRFKRAKLIPGGKIEIMDVPAAAGAT